MRILVVDDSRAVRTCMRQKLEKLDYEVIEAANGQEAMRKTRQCRPDLITMDIDMPEMDGFAATAAIRTTEEGRRIPIVFVTGKDTLEDREKGFHLGAVEFISKASAAPWQEVACTVNRMLRCNRLPANFTALVAEDNEVTRMLICSILRHEGLRVIDAADGAEALDLAKKHRTEIDLVITDFVMPKLDGGQLCVELRTKVGLRRTPIIFLSGVTERAMILNMFHAGATDYLMKPFTKEELLARIRVHMEQWELVKELNRTVGQLEHLNKLRDEFTAMATHDLKSPLNSVMGFTQILQRDPTLTASQLEMLGNIRDSSELMLSIIKDIVALGRIEAQPEADRPCPLPVAPLINVAVASLQQTAAAKDVLLDTFFDDAVGCAIDGNRNDFLRILNNLLTNAIKFTPSGGKVTLSLNLEEERKMVRLTVADTGIGIPPTMMAGLFDKFSKASRSGTRGEHGTGLGLAITRRLVEQHHGTISVTSTEGEGSCFRLTFPLLSVPL